MTSSSTMNNNNNNNNGGTGNSSSSSREYCLRWNNHQPNLATFFGSLYATESLVDVTLVSAEGKKIMAHKLVLAACSPYFQIVFENNPCKHPVVILKDVLYTDLESIVKFIYNGEVNISQDRMNSILKTANSLQVKGLAEVPADELKRVSSAVSEPVRSRHTPTLSSSASWDSADSANDIPRKKLKKSASANAYIPGSSNTNGDHSISVDSGVGTSISRSMDEPPSPENPPTVFQKRTSLPAPPPLLPKSKSLEIQRDTSEDSEMNASGSDQYHRQSYDDSSMGYDRGYDDDLEVADGMKIEGEYDDGDLSYYEDSFGEYYDEEGYGYVDNEDSPMPGLKTSRAQTSTTALVNGVREILHCPNAAHGERRRRGRPLIRQTRIKRGDNEPASTSGTRGDGVGYERDPLGDDSNDSGTENNTIICERGLTPTRETSPQQQQQQQRPTIHHSNSIHQSNVPIVRVSQCSPTPPSSPQHNKSSPPSIQHEEPQPVIVSTMSIAAVSSAGSSTPPPSSSALVITPTSHAQLLRVPSIDAPNPPTLSISGSHLVKQISQPSLPSHSVIPVGGIISGNPVIRRQNSTPAPGQQTRIIQNLKQGTVYQIIQTPFQERASHDEISAPSKTFIIDLQTVPPSSKDGGESSSLRRELKKENSGEHSGSFSREDSTSAEEIGSNASNSSFDDGLPVNRSGHCPALRPGPTLGCNFCWNSVDNCGRILRRKTKYHCPECHINLCIVPCFQEYHEKADKKKKPKGKMGLPKPSSM